MADGTKKVTLEGKREDGDHLPDLIETEPVEHFDLPRPGKPKEVSNVTQTSTRIPDLLVED